MNQSSLATYLLRDELLPAEAIQSAVQACTHSKLPFITYLVKENILASEKILACCTKYFTFPIFDLINFNINYLQNNFININIELILRYRIIPLFRDENALHVGISDPTHHASLSAFSFHTGLSIRPMLVCESALDKIITLLSRENRLGTQLESALSKITPIEDKAQNYDISNHDDGPISEFVDKLINNAVEQQASDIHIESFTNHCRIRFRRDGLLYEAATTPMHFAARIITRLKIMSHLNIAERRLPQDGRLKLQQSFMDIRINTCPTLYGEKIVLRILDASKIKLDIDALGFHLVQKNLFLGKLMQPQGLILVTGPTGSGKTITLYSALHFLNRVEKNISSVEDPIEIELAGINQINLNSHIGLDFSTVLRSLLRQDPDVIMVGEIRDSQTAAMAMQAAQTGHLVLSTLHTNSAIETIARLQSLGIATDHFINGVSLIIAQRLLRKLCNNCKRPERLTIEKNTFISYAPTNCNHCFQGYQGRIGIFELIPINEQFASLILSGANITKLSQAIKKENYLTLWDAGIMHVKNGLTSYAELLRVVGKKE